MLAFCNVNEESSQEHRCGCEHIIPNLLFASGSYSENKILSTSGGLTSGGPPGQRRKKTDINWVTEHTYRKREGVLPVLPRFVI